MAKHQFTVSSNIYPVVNKITEALNRAISYRDPDGVYHSLADGESADYAFNYPNGVKTDVPTEREKLVAFINCEDSGADGTTATFTWKMTYSGAESVSIDYDSLPYAPAKPKVITDMTMTNRAIYTAKIVRKEARENGLPTLTYTCNISLQ